MFKKLLILCLFTFTFSAEITEINASQRTDGSHIVDVCYDLSPDDLFVSFMIIPELSIDGGETWGENSDKLYNYDGDFGNPLSYGYTKQGASFAKELRGSYAPINKNPPQTQCGAGKSRRRRRRRRKNKSRKF